MIDNVNIIIYNFANIFFILFYAFYSVNSNSSSCNQYINMYLFLIFLTSMGGLWKYSLTHSKNYYKFFIANICVKGSFYLFDVCFIIILLTCSDAVLLCVYFNKICDKCLNTGRNNNNNSLIEHINISVNSISVIDIESNEEYTEIIKNVVEIDDIENEYDNICVICMEELECIKYKLEDNCNHVFHKDCIDKWLEVKNICPLCMK